LLGLPSVWVLQAYVADLSGQVCKVANTWFAAPIGLQETHKLLLSWIDFQAKGRWR